MRSEVRREISVSIQFIFIMLITLIAAFFWMLPGSGSGPMAQTINLNEAWKNVDPYVKCVLMIFTAFSGLRLAVVILASSFKKHAA